MGFAGSEWGSLKPRPAQGHVHVLAWKRSAEAMLTGLEATIIRIDDSSDDEPHLANPVKKKWVEGQMLAEDLCMVEPDNKTIEGHDSRRRRWSHSCSVSVLCRSGG